MNGISKILLRKMTFRVYMLTGQTLKYLIQSLQNLKKESLQLWESQHLKILIQIS
jgi:hypothetical protein